MFQSHGVAMRKLRNGDVSIEQKNVAYFGTR